MADKSIRLKQEGSRVLLIVNGVCVADMPWEAALGVGRACYQCAKMAEEHAKHNDVIADQALAFRLGLPVGLSNNRKIIEEAKKDALFDRDLRRYIRGHATKITVGTPGIYQEESSNDTGTSTGN